MRKIIGLLMILIMSFSVFVGCNANKDVEQAINDIEKPESISQEVWDICIQSIQDIEKMKDMQQAEITLQTINDFIIKNTQNDAEYFNSNELQLLNKLIELEGIYIDKFNVIIDLAFAKSDNNTIKIQEYKTLVEQYEQDSKKKLIEINNFVKELN